MKFVVADEANQTRVTVNCVRAARNGETNVTDRPIAYKTSKRADCEYSV